MEYLKMSDQNMIPRVGFGNYNSFGDEEINAITWALEAGYRYIDSATCYKNEADIGEALSRSTLLREDIFILSKLWPTDYEDAQKALATTLRELRLDYLDAYLIHWPGTDEARRLSAYEQIMKLREQGLIKTIGVSNFQPDQIEKLKETFGEYPTINQMECHPSFQQKFISDYCKERGITVIDYSPIFRGLYNDNPLINAIAAVHQKTPNQVVLRWHVQHGQIPIPKSSNKGRINENIGIFDFALTEEEMSSIDSLESGVRRGTDPMTFNGVFNRK